MTDSRTPTHPRRAAQGARLPPRPSLAVALAALLAFAVISVLVVSGASQRWDDAVLLAIYRHATPALDELVETITQVGSSVTATMVVVVASALLWAGGHRWAVLHLWVATLGGGVINDSLKELFGRPRPELWERMPAGKPSYPSGHAQTAVVIYGTLAYLIARVATSRPLRRLTLGVVAVIILLTGFSRMYLGVHYPTDVLAGYAVGVAWAIASAVGIEGLRYSRSGGRRAGGAGEEPGAPS